MFRNSLNEAPLGYLTVVALVTLLLPMVAQTVPAQEKWVALNPVHVPIGRDDHMMAFDSDNGLVVMFGGDNAGSATWVWDGEDWRDLGIVGPAPRRESAMIYDSVRKVVVMFGGYDYVISNNSTWVFNGAEWYQVVPEGSPDGRSDHAMAFDSERGLAIMFGGEGVDDATWAYDGVTWYSINAEGEGPSGRWGHKMVYDSERKKIVLFGGQSGDYLNDTWEWDGSWTEVTSTEGNPPAMRDHAMVYDSRRKKVVLFGGRDDSLEGFDSTWEWDGTAWTEVDTAIQPSPRHETAAAYDSRRDRMVLFGGSSGESDENRFMTDTWWYPNGPPLIEHDPVEGAFPAQPLEIGAEIFDYDEDSIKAWVHYRGAGEVSYLSVQMLRGEEDEFVGVIPAELVPESLLEYYIEARDPKGSGVSSFAGSPESPYQVTISDTGLLQVYIRPRKARRTGARWRVFGAKEWLKSGAVVRKLEPGEVTIQFSKLKGWFKPPKLILEVVNGRKTVYRAEYLRK